MYFVRIDLQQLSLRLRQCTGRHAVDLDRWLAEQGFVQATAGWFGSADSMNSLSCSEILYSERRHTWNAPASPVRIGPVRIGA